LIWVASRQHGREAALALGLIAITALFMVFEWSQMFGTSSRLGLDSCHGSALTSPICNKALTSFMDDFFGLSVMVRYVLMALPAVLGVFVAAPLIAREVEDGTHMFIWTQSITRTRWLSIKLIVLGLAVVTLAAAMSVLVLWWHQPLDRMYADGSWTFFDVMGLAPIAYALFAFALGVSAGAIIQRTVPAMAATLVVYTMARFAVYMLRPWLLPPMKLRLPAPAASLQGAWQLGSSSVGDINQTVTYQPAERFWTFQSFEASMFLVLSSVLILVSFLWLRHRIH
jgi:hypothetical protein